MTSSQYRTLIWVFPHLTLPHLTLPSGSGIIPNNYTRYTHIPRFFCIILMMIFSMSVSTLVHCKRWYTVLKWRMALFGVQNRSCMLKSAAPVDNADDKATLPRIMCVWLHLCAVRMSSIDSHDLGVLVKVRNNHWTEWTDRFFVHSSILFWSLFHHLNFTQQDK